VAVALYAGSFDPIHLGHLDIIVRAAGTFDHVVVGVLGNPEKPRGMFSPEQRVLLVRDATSHLPNVSCQHFHGLAVDLARSVGATVLIRVAHKDRHTELSMMAINIALAGMPTVMFAASFETRTISSSVVRGLMTNGNLTEAAKLVPTCVGRALAEVQPAAVD
jgi:pantetheine-phosphate adenylyltransferase